MIEFFKTIGKCIYKAVDDAVIAHDGVEHSGYVAFLALLSVFPFLVFMVSAASFLGNSDLAAHFLNIIIENELLPERVMEGLVPRLNEIKSGPPQGLLTVSILGAIWTASSMFEGLRTILNKAYRVRTPPAYILRRLLSIGQFLVMAISLLIVVFLFIIAPSLFQKLSTIIPIETFSKISETFSVSENSILKVLSDWHIYGNITSALIIFFIVLASYFMLPNVKQKWVDTAPGTFLVVVLWSISGSLFAEYMSNVDQVNIIYGSLGSFIAVILFFYITALIYIIGAEFNYHYAQARGHKIEAKE